ncbi:MAG: tetratricopeptide repeat protein, partial [Tannerella sp.]|nr:tetratricopeptide repeat protein [Tannerella sp.]
MTLKEINNVYCRIVDSLDGGALKTAFEWVQTLVSGTQLFSFQNRLNELQETYRYMLGYYAEGSEDPMQKQIYARIRTGAYELADRIRYEAQIAESTAVYYMYARQQSDRPVDVATLLDRLAGQYEIDDLNGYEASNDLLFAKLWTTPLLTEGEAVSLGRALKGEPVPVVTKCQIVSALLLGLQACFDVRKLYLLFDAAERDDEEISIRAYVAICLTLHAYSRRTAFYPGISHRLEILAETPGFKRILQTIALRFILSRETEKVSFMMRNEIIPELIKVTSKMNPDHDSADMSESAEGMNPEWFDMIAGSSLAKKIEEYSQLQEEGVDVMHSSFVDLKHFPFFHTVGNWFLPFVPVYALFASSPKITPATVEVLRQTPFLCNSDKYSFFFSLQQISERQQMLATMQMNSQFEAMNRQYGEELKSKQNRVESITGQYVQDLFRFYKLFPKRREFDDVFKGAPELHSLPVLKPYLSDPEILLNIAELYLRKGYFENAQSIYEQLPAHYPDDGIIYQKLGYCKQMSGDTPGALDCYLRAEMLNPDSKWLVRRIGHCYKTLKQPEKALDFYRRYEKMCPDNTQALIFVGHCYMEMKNYAEALKYYFKADYMERDSVRAWRAIAWCSFLCGKYEQARNYYGRILAHSPETQDCLNAGHTEWALRRMKNALAHYQAAIRQEDDSFEKFLTLFNQDIPDLTRAGIEAAEIP